MSGRVVHVANATAPWMTVRGLPDRAVLSGQADDARFTNRIGWVLVFFLVVVLVVVLVGYGAGRSRGRSVVRTWTTEPTGQQIAVHQ